LLSQLVCFGRHSITGLLRNQDRIQQGWTADYRFNSTAEVAHRLAALLESPVVADSCRVMKQRINDPMPAERVAQMPERFASQKCTGA
jgi:hypothetical protein